MVKIFIPRKANVFKIYKTLGPCNEYSTQDWALMLRYGNWNVILRLENIQKRVRKIII